MPMPPLPNEPLIVRCESFDDFTSKVRTSKWVLPRIFRGQRDITWPLWSLWERKLDLLRGGDSGRDMDHLFGPEGRNNRNAIRDQYLARFRDLAIGLPGMRSELLSDDKQAWALGRHHGLVTPLLDWSFSPFVALFFGCFDQVVSTDIKSQYGGRGLMQAIQGSPDAIAVWELAYSDDVLVPGEFEVFIARSDLAHRQKAQGGCFSLLTHATAADVASYLATRQLAFRLLRFELSGWEIPKALWNLRLMNITYSSLFPDLDGAAIEANMAYAMNGLQFLYTRAEEDKS
jgi:hypothetical protein